jgi:aspartate/methionine/tyrosine aminotransferase
MRALNQNLIDTGSPPIPEAYGWTERYDGRHGPLILLSQAAPTDPPPGAFLDRMAAAVRDPGTSRYGPIRGDAALCDAYAAHVSEIYDARVGANEIAITPGCNQAFVVTMMALAPAGSAVILPSPWYFNHKMTLDLLGVETRTLACDAAQGFVPNVADAERLIDGRVRAIVFVTPNNPTGAIYPPETIAAFADLARRRGLWLVIDETYRDFLPDGAGRPHVLASGGAWPGDVIQLYSFSKSYCIPGHRLGAIVAGGKVQEQMAKILDTLQICPPRAAQSAVAWAISNLAPWRQDNRRRINARGALFRRICGELDGWQLASIGSYFAYLRHPFEGISSPRVVEQLAAERGVLCLPATYFGAGQERFLRVAFANADDATLAALPARFRGMSMA